MPAGRRVGRATLRSACAFTPVARAWCSRWGSNTDHLRSPRCLCDASHLQLRRSTLPYEWAPYPAIPLGIPHSVTNPVTVRLSVGSRTIGRMTRPTDEHWLTTSEVAAVIRETRANVSRRCKRGEFPGVVQVGRNWRIPQTGLDTFLTPDAAPESPPAPVWLTAGHKREVLGHASRGGFRSPRQRRLAINPDQKDSRS